MNKISNIAQNGDDVIVKLGDGVNIEDLFPKGVTSGIVKTGLEGGGQYYPTIKKGTDGTLEILQGSQEHPNKRVKRAVKAYAIFSAFMRMMNIKDICVELGQEGGKTVYTIKKLKPGDTCPTVGDQTRQIPKTENIHVLFFVNKQGAGQGAAKPGGDQYSGQQGQGTQVNYGVRWNKCTKNNTVKRDIPPKGGKKFKIGDEVSVKFTAFAKNVGNVNIQCNENCYYECDICKDDKKGYVPDLEPNKTSNLVESCSSKKTKNFEVVFKVNNNQINTLQQHFKTKLAPNEVPLEVAILTREDCQENGKYYVEPDVLCVLFVTNKDKISLPPPPAGAGKKVKKAIVKIGGVTEVSSNPWASQKGKPGGK